MECTVFRTLEKKYGKEAMQAGMQLAESKVGSRIILPQKFPFPAHFQPSFKRAMDRIQLHL